MDPNQSLELNENDKEGYNTLDEPKRISLKRDVNSMLEKAKVALLPMKSRNSKSLQDWDFWGPLIFCLIIRFGFIMAKKY